MSEPENKDLRNDNTPDNGASEENKEKKINWKKEILSWVILIAVAYVLAFIITHFIIIKTEIISGSMIDTLNVGDKVVGNRLAYLFDDPQRGDVVFFKFPDNEQKTYVKRIIGLPGETVEIVDGKVYIDGAAVPLDEDAYLDEEMEGSFGPYEVPENCYFMLGDNRNVSIDSRYWEKKFVPRENLQGKAWFRYRPNLSKVEHHRYDEK